jgi:hypothetical protein|tara:strand:+ start:266 stop:571 length:306 start_codon:yes stop_codon:yes gene_type:complete
MQKFSLITVFVCLCIGCMDVTKVAPKVDTLGLQENIPLLEQGREVYINSCTKCHNAIRITRYPLDEWIDEILPDMTEESNLTMHQTRAVTAYVQAVLSAVK